MGARKKSSTKATSDEARGFAVVVETMHAELKVFGEALGGLRTQMTDGFEEMHRRFAEVDRRFDRVDQRFAEVDRRFDRVDQRFAGVDQRLDGMDQRFDRVERDLGLVKVAVLAHGRELRELRSTVTDLAATKVNRDEVETIVERVVARSGAR
jgi:archaellum component FlaC